MKKVRRFYKGFLSTLIISSLFCGCGGGSSGTGGENGVGISVGITRVTGKVTNDSQRPISDVDVSLEGNQTRAKTNSQGNFDLAIDDTTELDTDPVTNDVILQLNFVKEQLHAQVGVNVPASSLTTDLAVVINEGRSEVSSIEVNKMNKEPAFACLTAQYDPVCGLDGKTYPSPCDARGHGVDVAYEGECRKPQFACLSAQYDPVCGLDGKTYPSPCDARGHGVDIAYEGECRRRVFACIALFDPVCGTDGKTYSNECHALDAGVDVAYKGECRRRVFACIALFDPVCGTDGKTYSNECHALDAGVDVAYKGKCI